MTNFEKWKARLTIGDLATTFAAIDHWTRCTGCPVRPCHAKTQKECFEDIIAWGEESK